MNTKPELIIDILTESPLWDDQLNIIEPLINELSNQVLASLNVLSVAKTIELSITLTDNKKIKELNNKYRKIDKATNVLSFPSQEIFPDELLSLKIFNDYLILGDIVIAYETIDLEALQQNKSFKDHFSHMIIHGLLHLLGYDHQSEEDAEIMEKLETNILAKFSITCPYLYNYQPTIN
jgi:probable rRNA maturation factor